MISFSSESNQYNQQHLSKCTYNSENFGYCRIPTKRVRFNSCVLIGETFSKEDYDRTPITITLYCENIQDENFQNEQQLDFHFYHDLFYKPSFEQFNNENITMNRDDQLLHLFQIHTTFSDNDIIHPTGQLSFQASDISMETSEFEQGIVHDGQYLNYGYGFHDSVHEGTWADLFLDMGNVLQQS